MEDTNGRRLLLRPRPAFWILFQFDFERGVTAAHQVTAGPFV